MKSKNSNNTVPLSNPIDIERHRQFKKDVDDLARLGHLRHYTAEIKRETGESTGNISNYYQGKVPIGDNFLKKFNKAFGRTLKKIREPKTYKDLPLASNDGTQPQQIDINKLPPNTTPAPLPLSQSEQNFSSSFEQFVTDKLADIKASLERLEQKLDSRPKPPRKK